MHDLAFFYQSFICPFIHHTLGEVFLQLFEILCLSCLDILVPVNFVSLVTYFHIIWEYVAQERPQHRPLCSFLCAFVLLRKITILIFCYLCLK